MVYVDGGNCLNPHGFASLGLQIGRPWEAILFRGINALNQPVVAFDLPFGLDPTTGEDCEPCIRATATLTLALPKAGLVKSETPGVEGSLCLASG